jgi:hypothetical protein
MHSAPIQAPRPVSDGLHRAQWARTIAGYIVDVIEPFAMMALVGMALVYWSRSNQKGFLLFACIALSLTASRRLNNAIVAWTDLQDLTTYAWPASMMWPPTVAVWALAWNRWRQRPWRSLDVAAFVLAVAATIGAVTHAASLTRGSRLGFIGLFALIGARMVRSGGPVPALSLVTFASIVAALFGGELLDPLGVPGIWFPFGIGVSRTQYIYAIAVPLLALLIVLTLPSKENASAGDIAPATLPGTV